MRERGPSGTSTFPVSRIRRVVEDAIADDEDRSSVVRHDKVENDEVDPAAASSTSTFPPGAVIELYGPGSTFAFPTTVGRASVTGGAAKYHLTLSITGQFVAGVESRFVHEHQIYPRGTEASCNLGKNEKIAMVPCTVLSHQFNDVKDGGENDVVYQVRAKTTNGPEDQVIFVSRLKVMRQLGSRQNTAVHAR